MCRRWLLLFAACLPFATSCHRVHPDPQTLTVIIESSPTNLDPRIGTDANSQHIDELIFDGLLSRDETFHLIPALAESWEHPDPLNWIFHIRHGVQFHNGQPLTSRDVVYTLNSVRDGSITTGKAGAYKSVASVSAPDDFTVVIKLRQPDPALLWNLSSGAALGIVPAGSGKDFGKQLNGTGPFKFVRAEVDQEVVLERATNSWHAPAGVARIRFAVVPDVITAALELRKGSADLSLNFLTPDIVHSLAADRRLAVLTSPGTRVQYLGFNVQDAELRDVRVRQAIALAIDRNAIIASLLGGYARPANSVLPPNHWAYDKFLAPIPYDPARASAILDAAGYKRGADGTRFRLTMKTSTDENARLLAVVLQQQLRNIGIALDVRSFEFATFYADVVRGAFQMYSLRWVGGNEDPDILRYQFDTTSRPPNGANRGGYSSAALDAKLADARNALTDEQRLADYDAIQQMLARELPTVNLWYLDNVAVANRRVTGIALSPSGDFEFLKTVRLQP